MRILLIEDDEVDAEEFRRAVEKWGHGDSVEVVGRFDLAREVMHEFDAVVLDLGLPDMNFAENLDQLHELDHVPCVVFTGNANPELAYRIGKRLTGIVIKGKNPDALLCQVANQIGQFEAREERQVKIQEVDAEFNLISRANRNQGETGE